LLGGTFIGVLGLITNRLNVALNTGHAGTIKIVYSFDFEITDEVNRPRVEDALCFSLFEKNELKVVAFDAT